MHWKSKKSGKYKPIKGKELMKFHKFVEEEKIPVECRAFCPACSMCCHIDPPHSITKAKKTNYLNDALENLCLDKLFSNGNNELDDEETKGEDVQHFFCDYNCRFFGVCKVGPQNRHFLYGISDRKGVDFHSAHTKKRQLLYKVRSVLGRLY